MLPRERVITVIEHGVPDRMPIYAWVRANLSEPITERFGSVEAFEDHYEFDFAHLFGGPWCHNRDLKEVREELGGDIEPADLLDVPLHDPNDMDDYAGLKDQIRHHKEERGRFVYCQTPGLFEAHNGAFGIENHLAYLLLHEDDLHEVYRRQAQWNKAFAMNCLDLGVDMVHVSDDWGAQHGLMFSPEIWWKLIYPYHKITTDAVKARGAYLSLHSDGNVMDVLDGIIELGYDVLHPFQESAGMDLKLFHDKYRDKFTVMGGLDVQDTIGFGKIDRLKSEIERVMTLFADGGLLYCTTHFIQNHCGMEELILACDMIRDLAGKVRTPARCY